MIDPATNGLTNPLHKDPWGQSEHSLITTVQTITAGNRAEFDWLPAVANAVSKHVDAPSVRIWSLSPAADRLRLRTAVGLDLPFEALQEDVPVEHSELGQVVTSRSDYVADCLDESAPPDVRLWADHHRLESFLAVPIVAADRPWGVLGLFTRHAVSHAEREQLSNVAAIVGSALSPSSLGDERPAKADLLSSLVPCLSSAIVTLDTGGNVTHWSGHAERLFGWTEREALGKPLRIIPPERRHEFQAPQAMTEAGLRVSRSRTVCERADLRLIPVERTTGPLLDGDGQAVGRIEVFSDDTQRVRMSRRLEVQAQVAKVLAGCRGLDDGLPLLLGAIGEWLACDAAEFWNLDIEQGILSRASVWARSPETRDRLSATRVQIKANANDYPARVHRQRDISYEPAAGGGSLRPKTSSQESLRHTSAVLAVPIYRESQQLGVVICQGESLVTPDELTRQTLRFSADALAQFLLRLNTQAALARTEANLRQSQKMDAIGLLAGGVAHDFNNLLTIILAYSEMGLDELDEQHPLHELFAEIHGAGERAAAMTQQLLAVSRQKLAQKVAFNLNRLVDEMDRMLRRLLGAEISLIHKPGDELANIHGDVSQIEQVLLNLIVNARDALPEGGTITVATQNVEKSLPGRHRDGPGRGRYVELTVTDTGCGMDEETRSRIFEPFFTTKDVGKGTGMGLSTVFGIVNQHGGHIEVDSQVGVGTTFSVFLPQASAALATQSVDEPPAHTPGGTESVLIVESDRSIRTLIRRMLEVRGYTVMEAVHGREALAILSAGNPPVDLILTDVQLPVIDGVTVSHMLQARRPGRDVLVMSGNANIPDDLNLDLTRQFLRKPFTSEQLARSIRLAIDGNESARQ